jgi:hypothetical protein
LDSELENATAFQILALRESLYDSVGLASCGSLGGSLRERRYEMAKSRDGNRATREQLTDSQDIHDSTTWLPAMPNK